jgi:hypothetical protein
MSAPLNAARKLIAFIRDHAVRVHEILHLQEPTTGDLVGAQQALITLRGDLEELEQRVKAEVDRRRQRPPTLVPPLASDRDVDAYKAKLEASLGGAISPLATVESPNRDALNYTPGPRFPRGRYTFDHHARRLIAISGTLQLTKRPA